MNSQLDGTAISAEMLMKRQSWADSG